jgi:hypothetical protein
MCACGDDDASGTPDAFVGNVPDSAPQPDSSGDGCTSATFTAGPAFTAGASSNFFGVGAGAWMAAGANAGPPGDILYVEAYADLLDGTTEVDVVQFENWYEECTACVFYGAGCATYDIPLTEGLPDTGPVHCDKLYMLERAHVSFASLDTTPSAGRLMGTVSPLSGDSSIRMTEVYKTGEPDTPTGYGQRNPTGGCLELDSLAFNGSWGGPTIDAGPSPDASVDAGSPDAGAADASVPDADVADAAPDAQATDAATADANDPDADLS